MSGEAPLAMPKWVPEPDEETEGFVRRVAGVCDEADCELYDLVWVARPLFNSAVSATAVNQPPAPQANGAANAAAIAIANE